MGRRVGQAEWVSPGQGVGGAADVLSQQGSPRMVVQGAPLIPEKVGGCPLPRGENTAQHK